MKLGHITDILLVTTFVFLLSSCTTHIDEYQATTPSFDIAEYFNGELVAWGIVQDYNRKLTRRFCVELNGQWQGNRGDLYEQFYFADGERSSRHWRLEKLPSGIVTGTADDVDGVASGQSQGMAFQWQYYLNVAVGDTSYEFFLDDWMYQLDQYRLFNRSYMKKFGVTLAEISIFFDKETPNKTCSTFQ